MKYSLVAVSAFAFGALAQFPQGFPPCGVTCVTNMLALAPSLGCPTPDANCLCRNQNFAYGIRDCSNAACGADVAPSVIAYGNQYCAGATGGAGGAQPSATATPTTGGAGAGTAVPVTTSAISGLITSGGSTFSTIIGSTTILADAGAVASSAASSLAGSAGASASSVAASASSAASSLGAGASSSAASVRSSVSSAVGSATSRVSSAVAGATSTSTGGGARQTAFAGLAAAAGLAAMVL